MDVSFLEWNIHQQGRHSCIPPWVLDEVIGSDIIVLTEFCTKCASGDRFIKGMADKKYECFTSGNPKGNDVLIAVRKRRTVSLPTITSDCVPCYDPHDLSRYPNIPENLRVDINCSGTIFTVVGIRIRTLDNKSRRAQFKWILRWLKSVENPIIIAGDFNNYRRCAENKFEQDNLSKEERWSMVQIDRMLPPGFMRITPSGGSIFEAKKSFENQFAEDHFIIKGIQGLTLFPYDRSFIKNDEKNYPAGENFQKIKVGCPDHAILRGIFTLNDPDSQAGQ